MLMQAYGAQPTNYHGYSHRTVSRVRSRRYSNCCEIRWNPASLAPCVTFSVFLDPHPKFIQPLCRSHHLPLLDCALSCVTEERGETGDQLSMKDPNLNTREVVPHSTCGAQTVRL